MTIALSAPPARIDFARMSRDAPTFTGLALLLALALIPLYAAMALDPRLFQGDSPWLKPIKFHIALSIYLATLAFFARYMSDKARQSRLWQIFSAIIAAAILYEIIWVAAAASLNTASHFNADSAAWIIAYAVAGLGAVTLTSGSLGVGIAVARNRSHGLAPALHLSIWLGLILTFALTLIVAGYLSSNNGHFVGTSTRQLAILGWSRDAGDLRVGHMLATHAMHGLPLIGLIGARLPPSTGRAIVLAAAAGYTALVLGTFAQALMGQPFLGWLG